MRQRDKCIIDSCDQPARASGLCAACYSAIYRLAKGGVDAIVRRKVKVDRYQDRLKVMTAPASMPKRARQPKRKK